MGLHIKESKTFVSDNLANLFTLFFVERFYHELHFRLISVI